MKIKKWKYILLLISFLLSKHISAQNIDVEKVKKYVEEAREQWDIPGVAIGVFSKDTTLLATGFGFCDITQKRKVDENTIFAIASNTKPFTSSALATLVDAGAITWNDRVVDYLPYFRMYDPYVTEAMTIRDLLSHRSGLKTFSGDVMWYGSYYTREEIIRRIKHLKPTYDFRTEFGYSNVLFLAAGEIIPRVCDKSWDAYVDSILFKPLGMTRTFTSIRFLNGEENLAFPHNRLSGKNIKIPYVNWDNIGPAGSMLSSVTDLGQWIKLNLSYGTWNEKVLISEVQMRELWHPHINNRVGKTSERMWYAKHFDAYGLGWELMDYHGYKIMHHSGGIDGMVSQLVVVPELDMGFVVLGNNSSSLPYSLMFYLLDEIVGAPDKQDWSDMFLEFRNSLDEERERILYAEENKRVPNAKPTLPLESYTGVYEGKLYGKARVYLENGKLNINFEPTPIYQAVLQHWNYNTFSIKLPLIPSLPEGRCQFIMDENGGVEEMRIEISNPDLDFSELQFKRVK